MQNNKPPKITRNEGLALIELFLKDSLKPQAFCIQQKIPKHIFHYWHKIYKNGQVEQHNPSVFIPLKVPKRSLNIKIYPVLKIHIKEAIIEVPSGFDKLTLQHILEACQKCG